MKGFIHSRRLVVKSEGCSGPLRKAAQESIRDNPFLGLSSRVSPKLLPACPGVRSAVVSPSTVLHKYGMEVSGTKRPILNIGNFKLQPIKVVHAPRLQSISLPELPISPRPVKTPSFSEEAGALSALKQRSIVKKRQMPNIRRVTSLKVIHKEEVICSFGTNVWKRAKQLCPMS